MAKLTKIQIKNYRSIKDSGEVPITKLFALIGKNNTGKSTFLKAIQLLFCEGKDITASDFHKCTDESIEITGTIERWKDETKTTQVIKLTCEKDGKPKYSIDGDEKASAAYAKAIPSLLVIPDRRDAAEFTTGGVKTSLLKRIFTERRIKNDGELADISSRLEAAKRAEALDVSKLLTDKFREVAQEQTYEIKVEPSIDIEKSSTHTSALVDNDIPDAPIVGITECGTGIQSMYLLTLLDVYGDISQKTDEGILLIEEPEVYLHPEYQRRMFEAMRKIASDNQVIFSTHSPIMISEIWLTESVRQIRLVGGETKIEEVKVEDVISELGIRYEDVLNPKLTIFVEGETDKVFYERLGLKANDKVTFVATDGFRAMHYFAYIKILSSENVGSTFIAIADGDGEDQDTRKETFRKEVKAQFKDLSPKIEKRIDSPDCFHVLSKYSIESYLLDIEALSAAFPTMEKNDLEKFIAHYNAVYDKRLAEVKGNEGLSNFQKYARPKLLFDKNERNGDVNPKFEEAYYAFWENDEDFKRVRELLVSYCLALQNRWFAHILSHTNLEKHADLVAMRDEVLKLT